MRVRIAFWKCSALDLNASQMLAGAIFKKDSHVLMRRIPKVIPPRSRVRLVRADVQTPSWKKDIGRRFRVGYYSRKDGLDCIWLVNEQGEYEQTTNLKFLLKYFDVEHWSREKNFFGLGMRLLAKGTCP